MTAWGTPSISALPPGHGLKSWSESSSTSQPLYTESLLPMLTQTLCSCYSKESSAPPANIVAVDLQPMAPLEGVTSIRGDITSVSTAKRVIAATGGEKSQLVICDGAPDVTGLHTLDAYLQAQLLLAAFSITIHLLAPGGWFIAKIFRTMQDPRAELLVSQMRCFFPEKPNDEGGVWIRKPRSSREGSGGAFRPLLLCLRVTILNTVIFDSIEAFIVCRNFQPPPGLSVSTAALESASSDSLLDAFKHFAATSCAEGLKVDRSVEKVMGWVGSGDLSYVALYPWSTISVRADTHRWSLQSVGLESRNRSSLL